MVDQRAGGWARRKAVLWGAQLVDGPAANLAHLRAGSKASEQAVLKVGSRVQTLVVSRAATWVVCLAVQTAVGSVDTRAVD